MFCYHCIKSSKPFKKILRVIFTLGCFFATSYMANSQIMRLLENQDASTIEFKRFNLSPDDKYPDISICFTGHNLNWYDDDSVFNTFGITTAVYEQMLKGREGFDKEHAEWFHCGGTPPHSSPLICCPLAASDEF